MHLNELKKVNPKAYERFVEMLVEDCTANFTAYEDGTVYVRIDSRSAMDFDPRIEGDMSVGAGWK